VFRLRLRGRRDNSQRRKHERGKNDAMKPDQVSWSVWSVQSVA